MAVFRWEVEENHASPHIAHSQPRQRWSAQVAADKPLTTNRHSRPALQDAFLICEAKVGGDSRVRLEQIDF